MKQLLKWNERTTTCLVYRLIKIYHRIVCPFSKFRLVCCCHVTTFLRLHEWSIKWSGLQQPPPICHRSILVILTSLVLSTSLLPSLSPAGWSHRSLCCLRPSSSHCSFCRRRPCRPHSSHPSWCCRRPCRRSRLVQVICSFVIYFNTTEDVFDPELYLHLVDMVIFINTY